MRYTPFFYETGERIDGILYIGKHLVDADVDSGTVTIREGTLTIAENAFDGCGMTKVVIPDGITYVPKNAFAYCSKLTEVVIPDSVTEIYNYAFQGCAALTEITIPQSVKAIGEGAFSGCAKLEKITLPDKLTVIGDSAFDGCKVLTSVTLPESLTTLPNNLFWGCSSLTEVVLPDSITKLAYGTFRECTSLKEYTIPDNITYVDNSVFEGCSNLEKLTVPASVTYFSYNCLSGCTSLKKIYYDGTRAQWDGMEYNALSDVSTLNQTIYGKDFTLAPLAVEYKRNTYSNTIIITGAKSFVTDLVIPEEIDGYPVTVIDNGAFTNNSNIVSVSLPDGLEYVMYEAFEGTAFYDNEDNWDNGILYAGKYLLRADPELSGTVSVKEGTEILGEFAFQKCIGITEIILTDSVNTIMSGAFSNCSSLAKAKLPDNITALYGEMFYNCTALKEVTLPKNLAELDAWLFYGCTSLENIYISNVNYGGTKAEWDAITIGEYGNDPILNAKITGKDFELIPDILKFTVSTDGTAELTSCVTYAQEITIPAEYEGMPVARINMWAFEYCNMLSSINVDENSGYFKSIDGVLYSADMSTLIKYPACKSDESYIVPDSVTAIERYAFNNCTGLKTIEYAGSKSDWEMISIGDYNEQLSKAEIIFAKQDPAFEIAEFDGIWYNEESNEVNVDVYVDGIRESFAIMAAMYDDNNRLIAIEKVTVTTDDSGVVSIQLPAGSTYIIPKLKLLFRNDDNLSIPLDKPIVVENIMF